MGATAQVVRRKKREMNRWHRMLKIMSKFKEFARVLLSFNITFDLFQETSRNKCNI